MLGDQTLFIRGDEAEAAWAVIDPIEQGWAQSKQAAAGIRPGKLGPAQGDGSDRTGRPTLDVQRRWGDAADYRVFAVATSDRAKRKCHGDRPWHCKFIRSKFSQTRRRRAASMGRPSASNASEAGSGTG